MTNAQKLSQVVDPTGASYVGFTQVGTSAVSRSVSAKLGDVISVKDFGAVGDGAHAILDTAAVAAAVAYLQTNGYGGILYFPPGIYNLTNTITLAAAYSPIGTTGGAANVIILGAGQGATQLNFSGCSASYGGIWLQADHNMAVRDLSIVNSQGYGIQIGSAGGTDSFTIDMENVFIANSAYDGLVSLGSYGVSLKRVTSQGNGYNGFSFREYSTSNSVDNCQSSSNGMAGYLIQNMVYSTFTACGSDANALSGYDIRNCQSLTFIGCGTEKNLHDGWLLSTSNAYPVSGWVQDVHGITFIECVGYENGYTTPGTFAMFIHAVTQDSRPISFTVKGGGALQTNVADSAFLMQAYSGGISYTYENFNYNTIVAADVITSGVYKTNLSLVGKSTLASFNTLTTQSIPDITDTLVAYAITSNTPNWLGATLSAGHIIIPAGVSRVKVFAGVGWETPGTTGSTLLYISKNNAKFPGGATQQAWSSIWNTCTSAIVDVVAGDTIEAYVWHSNGAALNAKSSPSTFLSVEVTG